MLSGNRNSAPQSLFPFLHHVQCHVLNHCLFASLRGPDVPLFQFEDASFSVAKEKLPHPLADGERDHLRDRLEACDRTTIRRVFPVATIEDEDRPSFEEPVVLIVPRVGQLPLNHLLHQLKYRIFDGRALPVWEGVDTVDPTCLPRGCAAEDLLKLRFSEVKQSASPPSPDNSFHLAGDFQDGPVSSPSVAHLVINTPPELQRFLRIRCLLVSA